MRIGTATETSEEIPQCKLKNLLTIRLESSPGSTSLVLPGDPREACRLSGDCSDYMRGMSTNMIVVPV